MPNEGRLKKSNKRTTKKQRSRQGQNEKPRDVDLDFFCFFEIFG